MKKIIIIIIICIITFGIIILSINSKESKKENENNNNISIILETEEGNLESNNFPSKEEYEYNKVVCENTNDTVTPTFNNETWKLSLNVEEESIDGNFNCSVYFKEKIKTAAETLIEKATEGNSEGLITINQPATGQTEALTEYRYSGSNDAVKNYVNFNNETWRIIGVFPTDDGTGNIENRVKIVREESIGAYSWDTSDPEINSGYGINQWGESGNYKGADLMRLLNPGYESESINNSLYWNKGNGSCYSGESDQTADCDFSSTGLTEESKKMINDAVWYTSGVNYQITASESYVEERNDTSQDLSGAEDGVLRTINWTAKLGLIYPSDYGYASSGCRNGEQTLNYYGNSICKSTNWLFNDEWKWTITPNYGARFYVNSVLSIGFPGSQTDNLSSMYAYGNLDIYPVTYLSSGVKITGGTGTIDGMYELEI